MSTDGLPASSNWPVVLLRLGLVAAGALLIRLAIHVAYSAPVASAPVDIAILVMSGFIGLSLIVAAGVRRPPSSLRWLILLAFIGEVIVRSMIWAQTSVASAAVTIDPAIYADLAAELFRHGENPYEWDLSGALNLYRASYAGSTPRLNAANVESFSYPALAFLLPAIPQTIGLPGAFVASIVAYIAVLALLFVAAPSSIQPIILIPTAVGTDFILTTLIGSLDIVWVALLVGMVVAWRSQTWRAVLFGLSIAVKQIPWLIVPFLIIRIWRETGEGSPVSRLGRFLGISVATFVALNGLFILKDARAWLEGITTPLLADLVILSEGGISTITQSGLMHLPKGYYLTASLTIFAILLLTYWRHYQTLRDALWIFPGIFMWFSYRTLSNYWTFWAIVLLASLITRSPLRNRSEKERSWKPTVAIISVLLVSLLAVGAFLSLDPVDVRIRLGYPLYTTQGRITRITVEVTNQSDRKLSPRFSVQRFPYPNSSPWHIDSGPLELPPGQSATYQISNARDDLTFFAGDMAQVIVSDAGGDYSLRSMATIGPDQSFLSPDAIPNPAYEFWDNAKNAPIYWSVNDEPPGSGSAVPMYADGKAILKLELDAEEEGLNRIAVQNWIDFPTSPFGIWLYWNPPEEDPSSVIYGLEIDDGKHLLWFIYSSEEYSESPAEVKKVIYQAIPQRTWVYKEIDIPAAYAEANWPLPALSQAPGYRGLDIDLRMVNLRLFLAASGPRDTSLEAFFGPIEQEDYRIRPQTLMAETLEDPVGYYRRLASFYEQRRNYGRALQAYQQALQFSPDNLELMSEIERLAHYVDPEYVR